MLRYRACAAVVVAPLSLSLFSGPASAQQLPELRQQIQDLQKQLQDLTAKQEELNKKLEAEQQSQVSEQQKLQAKQQELEKQQAEAKQQQAQSAGVSSGDFPGSFKLPGTDTSLRIGGYTKLDVIYDVKASQGDSVSFSSIPLDGTAAARRQGTTRLDARQSRINFETRTPTEYGTLRTFVEGDFFGTGGNDLASNSSTFRIRHAYGELGHVLAGQTWSNFMDLESLPETVDFNGPAGQVFVRQAQLRYTQPLTGLGGATRITFAIENPEGDFFAPGTAGNPPPTGAAAIGSPSNALNQIPDFTARFATDQTWGHLSLAALARQIQANEHAKDFGYGLSLGATLNTFGRDHLFAQINGGNGIGRYLQDGVGSGADFNGTTILNSEAAFGAFGGYTHWWTDTIRSSAVYGHDEFNNNTSLVGFTNNRSIDGVHVNIFWSPVPESNVGFEYIYGRRQTDGGQHGEFDRLQGSVQYLF
jgi:hypothetical protein